MKVKTIYLAVTFGIKLRSVSVIAGYFFGINRFHKQGSPKQIKLILKTNNNSTSWGTSAIDKLSNIDTKFYELHMMNF